VRVLGIDPGSRFTGYGVVEAAGSRLTHVGHGVIRADARAPLETRLKQIFEQLSEAVALFRPEAVAVEGLFTFRNARSALVLGHARGVALLVAAQTGLPVFEYAPARVKKAVGAGGGDGKEAVARMVHLFLRVSGLERADASDALAVAICHLAQQRAPLAGTAVRRRGPLASFADRLTPALHRFGTASR
jgi:crossover junction endodeoxyribonuclease RuvC